MDFARIAALKKDNLEALTPEGRDIATRNCAAERRYVFALFRAVETCDVPGACVKRTSAWGCQAAKPILAV